MKHVGDLLSGLGRELNLDGKTRELALLALWEPVVEPLLAPALRGHSRAVRLIVREGKEGLLVRAADAVTATELSFQLEALCEALNRYSPQTGITVCFIRLQVGTLRQPVEERD